jgi:hypothetical protein
VAALRVLLSDPEIAERVLPILRFLVDQAGPTCAGSTVLLPPGCELFVSRDAAKSSYPRVRSRAKPSKNRLDTAS